MKRKSIIALLIIVLLILGGTYWWFADWHKKDSALTLRGNVDIRQVSLAFEGSGRVAELRAEEGDSVKAGEILALLDTTSLKLQADQAIAQMEVQRQTLTRLHNGARPQELAQAKSRLAAAEADTRRAEYDLARLEDVVLKTQGRGVSAQDIDRARSNAQVTKAKSDESREALKLTELGPRKEEVAGAAAQFKASQAQLALLQYQISQGELRAPTDAVIRSRLLEPGDIVSPQRAVFALALIHPKWIRVYVNESDLSKVKPGAAVQISTDSNPAQTVEGSIGYISSVAEFTPKSVQTEELRTSLVYEVRVVTEDKNDRLRLGQPATVRLADGTAQ